jgi:hypothetical protein
VPLPILADTAIVRLKFWGTDGTVSDLLNVQHYIYHVGASPTPGGLDIGQVAANAGFQWGEFWKVFQSSVFVWYATTINLIASFVGLGGSAYRTVLTDQWTVPQNIPGDEAATMLPNYCAYGVRKISPHPGRGGQGQVRVSGVPADKVVIDKLNGGWVTTIQTALDANFNGPLALNIGLLAATDWLEPVTIDGKLINADPGHVPQFYRVPILGVLLSPFVRTQITREVGRRRHH